MTVRSSSLATAKEVAREIHSTEGSLAQARYKGEGIPFVKIGRKVLYRWSDVDKYIESHVATKTGAA